MSVSPLHLNSADVVGDVVIHLVSGKEQLSSTGIPRALAERLGTRFGKDELVYLIAGEHRTDIIAKTKEEEEPSYRNQAFRALGAKLRSVLNAEKVAEASLVNAAGINSEHVLQICEGMALANYQFISHKTGDRAKPNALKALNVADLAVSQQDLNELMNVVSATCATRDLVNEPPAQLTATVLSQRITELGRTAGFSVQVLDRKQISALGMGGLLAVNHGSVEEPTFSVMEYAPKDAINSRPIVLVGKGVTYDTGGYSIKTQGMAGMKADMAGAAAVVGAMVAIASNSLPVKVIGLIPATDNRIDGKAIVPDDVITMMSGTKVEVLNTDAEGRLILADALHYAKQYDPELVIDLATLTGAAARITAHHGSAMCADRAPQKQLLTQCGEETYERLMEFPMWREFHDAIRSDVADIKNIGGIAGGNITAATFLHHFTDYPWIHLDIAGPSMMESDSDYRLKGATGVGVRLLYRFIKRFAES